MTTAPNHEKDLANASEVDRSRQQDTGAGAGLRRERHKAALIIAPGELGATESFFLMADDNITLGRRFGDAHLHAGLETVTFMLNGTMEDTGGRLEEGDVESVTAAAALSIPRTRQFPPGCICSSSG